MKTLWESHLSLPLVGRGKVRDIYAVGDDQLLIVTSDRLSAFDHILPNPIPYKGKVLTQTSVFWFHFLKDVVPNHLVTADVSEMHLPKTVHEEHGDFLEGRSMLVKRAKPYLIECVVRGYLTGSGWNDYIQTSSVCGHKLPKGLKQCAKLPEPIFTPATKAVSGHDENISFEEAARVIPRRTLEKLRSLSIELYRKGSAHAESKGIIVADTKFEFGELNGKIILIDEVLTPDSSRFWLKAGYEPGHDQPSFDKQIVRNYCLKLHWNRLPPAPELSKEVIQKTSSAYQDVYKRLVGKEIE